MRRNIRSRSFVENLRSGNIGLKFPVSDSLHVVEMRPSWVILRDRTHKVAWQIAFTYSMLDLQLEHDQLLKGDIKLFLRGKFETETPRTENPEWSPLIEMEYATLQGSKALLVIYRSAYELRNEVVVGELHVPVDQGLVILAARIKAGVTGMRESAIVSRAVNQGVDPRKAAAISQEQIDDPRLDVEFPDHPLSLVRAAMHWLIEDAGLEITMPMAITNPGEVRLPEAYCTVILPPRYTLNLPMSQMMSEGLYVATRACPPGPSGMNIDIWRLPGRRLNGWFTQARLKRLAVRTISGWKQEGAAQIKIEAKALPRLDGRTQIDTYVRFRPAGEEEHSVMRWFIDLDGQVFRVGTSAPLFVPRAQLADHVESVVQSWRRLSKI